MYIATLTTLLIGAIGNIYYHVHGFGKAPMGTLFALLLCTVLVPFGVLVFSAIRARKKGIWVAIVSMAATIPSLWFEYIAVGLGDSEADIMLPLVWIFLWVIAIVSLIVPWQ